VNWSIRPAEEHDWNAVEALLVKSGLPLAGAREHLANFLVAFEGGALAGCGGFESYDGVVLLRSMAVVQAHRGAGLGAHLTRHLLDRAFNRGAKEAILLTTTAGDYFARFGFVPISRESAPEAVQKSEEFRGACPDSALVMRLTL
jgi:N-acetylglutamate synthase-like GNAT family acetyltransferase